MDPIKQAAIYIKLNEMVIADNVLIPLLLRPAVAAVKNGIKTNLSSWDTAIGSIYDWYREA